MQRATHVHVSQHLLFPKSLPPVPPSAARSPPACANCTHNTFSITLQAELHTHPQDDSSRVLQTAEKESCTQLANPTQCMPPLALAPLLLPPLAVLPLAVLPSRPSLPPLLSPKSPPRSKSAQQLHHHAIRRQETKLHPHPNFK